VIVLAREKISDENKRQIAKMNLHGSQFKSLSKILGVSETTTRKADKIGSLLNKIDGLEYDNRFKDVQIMMLKSQRIAQPFKKLKHH